MSTLWLDLETFSDISLKKSGAYRYAEDCEILLCAWAWNNDPVLVDDWTLPGHDWHSLLADRIEAASEVRIHNSAFDRTIMAAHGIHLPVEKVKDTMVAALSHGLPGKLEMLCDVLGVPRDLAKDKDGKKLINLFCKPRPKNVKLRRATRESHPDEWQRFIEYARLDVDAMRAVSARTPRWNDCDTETHLWRCDQATNDVGFAVDRQLAVFALRAFRRTSGSLADAASRSTDGQVASTTQRDKVLAYVRDICGEPIPDLQKGTVEQWLQRDDLDPVARELLLNRQQAAATSPAKYQALLDAVCADGRLRGTIQFCGAMRTGRDAGRIFQPQNLPRPTMKPEQTAVAIEAMKADCEDIVYAEPVEIVTNAIRGCLVAPEGKKLVVADLSNIEGRVNAWLAGEDTKLEAFRAYDAGTGPDLYRYAYAKSFGIGIDAVTPAQRQVGKVMELAFGYQGAVGAFNTMGATYGLSLPEDEIVELVKAWRAAHPRIKSNWYNLEDAARAAIANPGEAFVVRMVTADSVFDDYGNQWLRLRLPSGRYLSYMRPEAGDGKCAACDGAGKLLVGGFAEDGGVARWEICRSCQGSGRDNERRDLTYEGIDAYTRQWKRLKTYGGSICENIVQATARDVFMAGFRRAVAAGYKVVLRVHDELVTEVPDSPEWSVGHLSSLMSEHDSWMAGLPLAAAGFEAYRYGKPD